MKELPKGGRRALRVGGVLMMLALLVLWVALVHYLFQESGGAPAPAVFMLPILFFSLAVWAGVGAVKDEPIVMVVAGGLSFFPTGLFLLFIPGFVRWIGILDLAIVATGVTLLYWGAQEEDLALREGSPVPARR